MYYPQVVLSKLSIYHGYNGNAVLVELKGALFTLIDVMLLENRIKSISALIQNTNKS